MPRFRWKGLGGDGLELEGETSGPSANHVLDLLRAKAVAVTAIEQIDGDEPAGPGLPAPESSGLESLPARRRESLSEGLARERATQKPRRLRGLLIAAGFFLGALGVGYFAPITVCRCERTATGSVDCTLSERDLGFLTIREQRLSGVTSVEIESRSGTERPSAGHQRWKAFERLVLGNGAGASIRPSTWDESSERIRSGSGTSGGPQWLGASTEAMRDTIAGFLSEPTETHVSTWQGQWVPLVLAGVQLAIALSMLGLALLSLFKGPTEWIYASTGRLAAAMDERRRGR